MTYLAGKTRDLNLECHQPHHTTAKVRGGDGTIESRQGKEDGREQETKLIENTLNAATLMRPTLAPLAEV